MANGSYSWLTLSEAITDLAQRLSDPAMDFWTSAELTIYIQQSLRLWNSLTWQWRQDFVFNSNGLWNSLGSLAGSPRIRTLTDTYCYTEMEYMLLEPATGNMWTGTNQFSISDLSDALLRRRNQMIKVSNCNQVLLPNIPLTPNTIRTLLPDTTLDVERVRYMPVTVSTTGTAGVGTQTISVASTAGIIVGQIVIGTGVNYWSTVTGIGSGSIQISLPTTGTVSGTIQFTQPSTLYRDDTVAQEFYESPLYQQVAGTPNTFSLSSEPPLSWQVDIPPNQAGQYEAVVLQAGTPFNPSVGPTLLNIPDDFAWVAEWGALADILGQESESTDRERSEYALKRYQDGLNLLTKAPWIELGKVNGQAVSVDSIVETDRYSPEWDSNPTGFGPVIVAGGIDNIACPVGAGIGVSVLGNAPVPNLPGDFVQVAKGSWQTVLDFAQARSCFKMGGQEFRAALEVEKRAIQQCSAENTRLRSQGSFSDILIQRGTVQERGQNRYNDRGRK